MLKFFKSFFAMPKQDPYSPPNIPTEGPIGEMLFKLFMENLFTGLFEYLDKKDKEENETDVERRKDIC